MAVTEVDWRLIYPSVNADRAELYDRGTDPREQRNLAEERPEVVAELRRKAETYLASPPASWGTAPSVEIDDMELRQLRALGYSVGGGGS